MFAPISDLFSLKGEIQSNVLNVLFSPIDLIHKLKVLKVVS